MLISSLGERNIAEAEASCYLLSCKSNESKIILADHQFIIMIDDQAVHCYIYSI